MNRVGFTRNFQVSTALMVGALLLSPIALQAQKLFDLAPAMSKKQVLDCKVVPDIETLFLISHIKYSKKDTELQTRVIEQYLKRLDPTKVYLLESDANEVKAKLADIFQKTDKGNCKTLMETQAILQKRVDETVKFAKEFLGKDYKFDKKAEFIFDPEKKPYPKTMNESHDYLKKYIHFQIANYVATDMKLAEAKTNVIKSYDRSSKKLKETTEEDIIVNYLDTFARALDPHSSYFSKDQLEDFEIQMRLSLQGIGATLSSQDGFTVVDSLVPGGAAAKSGKIEPQDRIVAVAQAKGAYENVIDMDLKDVVKKIRGPKGTTVRLSIMRLKGASKERFEVVLTRDIVNLEDEAASISYIDRDIEGGKKRKLGIINFPSFYADSKRGGRSSARDLKNILAQAKAKKVDGIVLDLSTNGGGSLDDAVKIAGLFFKTGNVVKQSARGNSKEAVLADEDPTVDFAGPLVVLTSRISASASEIVAGTLQDYKRAVIVGGDHTFGKGSVQSVQGVSPISNALGALKVTVGMFYIPGGNSTQHRGVTGDIVLPGPFATDEMGEKALDYSLPPTKIPPFLSKEAYVTEGDSKWDMIRTDWIKVLAEKSKIRVDKDPEFKKIVDEVAKSEARGKVIKVAEVLKDKNEKDKKQKEKRTASREQKNQEYLKRPEIVEAASVLMDLIDLESPTRTVGN